MLRLSNKKNNNNMKNKRNLKTFVLSEPEYLVSVICIWVILTGIFSALIKTCDCYFLQGKGYFRSQIHFKFFDVGEKSKY